MNKVILCVSCLDTPGLVASFTNFVYINNGNIINLDQHTDSKTKMFFMRLEWDSTNFLIEDHEIENNLNTYLQDKNFQINFNLKLKDHKMRMALFVSKYQHCYWDLLTRLKAGELICDIPLIISNHLNMKPIAEYFNIPFYHVPITPDNKKNAEKKEFDLLKKYQIDFVVLARYMQVLSSDLIKEFPYKIINIHHSFLPSFKGANPYKRAFERGVKMIGATAHFVTEDLDQGPIIIQKTINVTHKDSLNDMISKGRDIEKAALFEAVKLYTQNRLFVHENKTVVL